MPMRNRYPIYIPSKGRAQTAITPRVLQRMGIPYQLVVEDADADEYAAVFGRDALLVLPFSNLGHGSIPARNWIWDHALAGGNDRHWVIDDNITLFRRLNLNRKIPVNSVGIFRAAEDFTDRYENVALSGFNYGTFAKEREPNIPPFAFNTRVYSCILVNSSIPYRWRGRYNEDTDLCLRALKDGWCTVLFNAFLADKQATMTMSGGNTEHVYNNGDHRLAFAESLRDQHPDVVSVTWKFDRWHHSVDYGHFKRNTPRYREGVVPTMSIDEYGMVLRRK